MSFILLKQERNSTSNDIEVKALHEKVHSFSVTCNRNHWQFCYNRCRQKEKEITKSILRLKEWILGLTTI